MKSPARPVDPLVEALSQEGSWARAIGSVQVTFGAGCIDHIGRECLAEGASQVLLVTDSGLRATPHVDRALAALQAAGIRIALYDGAMENPTAQNIEEGRDFAARYGIDLILALGGGSSMDCAKGINFLLTNGGNIEDYWGYGKAAQPMLRSIAVPTTAGTGSEAQSYALITRSPEQGSRKMACGDPKARFARALLDPELLATAPRRVAAATAIDAVSHALESFVCTRRNPLSSAYAARAWELLIANLEAAWLDRGDVHSQGGLLLGAHLAGAAIEQSMLGAAHAAANPLTATAGIIHGHAVALMLPHVIRYNEPIAGELYRELDPDGAGAIATRVEELRVLLGLPTSLRDVGIDAAAIPELAERAAREWTREFNPRPVDTTALRSLYEAAF